MDGVLTDSEPVILRASILGLREWGIDPMPEDFTPFIGTGEDRFIGGVAEKYGLTYIPEMKKRVYEIYLDIVDECLHPFDRVPETLQELKAAGYRLALASSADMIKINANLKAAGVAPETFDCILGGEDVTRKKPAPDIYLLAAERLGLSPEDCTVVEDALNGVQAAGAAGMECIGVTTSFTDAQLREAGAFVTVDQMCRLTELLRGK
jgi:HAD superfamily hydrolase (TIGR01509 family)